MTARRDDRQWLAEGGAGGDVPDAAPGMTARGRQLLAQRAAGRDSCGANAPA
jgi:hypothetical protein